MNQNEVPNEGRFPVANIPTSMLSRIKELENDLQATTKKEVILIAYEDIKQSKE